MLFAKPSRTGQDLFHLSVKPPVGGQDIVVEYGISLAVNSSYPAAGLADNQGSRGCIPRVQVIFPETVETTAGLPAQIKCRRTGPSNCLRFFGHTGEIAQIIYPRRGNIVAKTGRQHSPLEFGLG